MSTEESQSQYTDNDLAKIRLIADMFQNTADELNRIARETERLKLESLTVRGVPTMLDHFERCQKGLGNFQDALRNAQLQAITGVQPKKQLPSVKDQAAKAVGKLRSKRNRDSS